MKIVFSHAVVSMATLTIVGGLMVGCGGPSPTAENTPVAVDSPVSAAEPQAAAPRESAPKAEPQAKPEPQKKPAPKPKPKAEPPRVPLLNRSFEVVENGIPKHWKTAQPEAIAESVDASDGVRPLALTGLESGWSSISQALFPPPLAFGNTLVISVDTKSHFENVLVLQLTYIVDGAEKAERIPIPKSDEFAKTDFKVEVPSNANPNTFRFAVLIRENALGKHLVDNVRISVEEK